MSDNKTVPDVDKVIRGLDCCGRSDSILQCEKCPYADSVLGACENIKPLMNDALALIEAQRRTLDEIDKYVRELDKEVNGNERTVSSLGDGNMSRYYGHYKGVSGA